MITIDGKTYRTLPEQVEENTKDIAKLETDTQGAMSELRNQVNYTAQRLIETIEDVTDLDSRVDSLEDTVTENTADIENLKTADSNIQGAMSELRNEVNYTSQRLIETIEDVAELEDDVSAIKSKKWYEHNIILQLRSANASIQSADSDGALVATLTLINQDPLEYTFSHNQDTSQTGPKVMPLQEAWQLLRLYRAIQLSTDKNLNLSRPCSGALVKVTATSPYDLIYCINNSISTKYHDFSNTDYKRMLVVHASRIGETSYVGNYTTEISVGHPTFINGEETSLWTTRDEFAAGEYNLTDSFGKSYSTYFCQQRMYCQDTVRELIGFGE